MIEVPEHIFILAICPDFSLTGPSSYSRPFPDYPTTARNLRHRTLRTLYRLPRLSDYCQKPPTPDPPNSLQTSLTIRLLLDSQLRLTPETAQLRPFHEGKHILKRDEIRYNMNTIYVLSTHELLRILYMI